MSQFVRVDALGVPHAIRADAPPYRIPDWVPPDERVRLLDELVELGLRDAELVRTAAVLRGAAYGRWITDPARGDLERVVGQTILDYVQGGGYREDPPGEWYQGPAWTLRYAGNCNDLAVLFCTLGRAARLHAEPWWITQRELRDRQGRPAERDHVLAGVRMASGSLCWAESTLDGARFCENPYRAAQRLQFGARNLGIGPS